MRGLSNRPAEAARLGYLGARTRRAVPAATIVPEARRRADIAARHLLESLLDERQLAERQRHRRWWVEVDRGWVQMGGSPHDIRFRPTAEPGREWSLCIVPADPALPADDVWSTLLLTATNLPDTFFRVAHRSAAPGPTPAPADVPREIGPAGHIGGGGGTPSCNPSPQ